MAKPEMERCSACLRSAAYCRCGLLLGVLSVGGMSRKTDWRNLPAGPELDCLILERVFGWTPARNAQGERIGWKVGNVFGVTQCSDVDTGRVSFSRDPGAAWLVVEAMAAKGYHPQITDEWMSYPRWRVEFRSLDTRRPGENLEKADTFPMACCWAALAALEVG